MAEATSSFSGTQVVSQPPQQPATTPVQVLKLKNPKNDKKVKWTNETVDNEHLNKKKSKCCCIYEKPRMFGESSDEEEDHDCTGHCRGHKDKCYRGDEGNPDQPGTSDS
ncbi:E3 ubiquitin-protein ligase PPP1R11-like [Dreissena polymorpha]|uniref:E3 ubiquitin-protein ligase PPP1R11 n=1 Tax=Dreissena polymorpha TaxID=45954 RepID=A0A9D4FJX9_DREPO|nr:E3 ubiquitin-protein ligase PPP1R11-like isoform X2 [Dreissena polymorpha]XP_052221320.1 E3 ubiquitin-protein ligase PPP1R11-like [Dreissena polymorpha]KAH3798056.1 hypothetical protein DPMN_151646 [Dreissena polymorpha]